MNYYSKIKQNLDYELHTSIMAFSIRKENTKM
jgi:diphthamide biosynthesis methyltransferase